MLWTRSAMAVGRPAVSQHLKVLRQAGLVTARAQGTRRLYALDPRGAEALARYTQQLWAAALGRFGEAVDDGVVGAGRTGPAATGEGREERT
jgi:DNA-binding transcriptional ArsR family regulator